MLPDSRPPDSRQSPHTPGRGSTLIWITCRNYEDYLPDAVASAWAQTSPLCEVRVAHDACGAENPEGVAHMRNLGLTAAQRAGHDYIVFLDADDVLPPEYVERVLDVARGDPCVVATDGRCFGADDGEILVRLPINLDTLLEMNTVHCSALVPVARAGAGFDPKLAAYEDWDFWCRLAAAGVEFRYCTGTRLMIRRHAASRHTRKTVTWADTRRDLIRRYKT